MDFGERSSVIGSPVTLMRKGPVAIGVSNQKTSGDSKTTTAKLSPIIVSKKSFGGHESLLSFAKIEGDWVEDRASNTRESDEGHSGVC